MNNATDFYYDNQVCPECGGHQKNCEHFWAGHAVGKKFGDLMATERIIKLLKKEIKNVSPGFGQSRFIAGLEKSIALIKGETK